MVSKPRTLALLSVLVVAGLGIWGWSLHPEYATRWAFRILFLPALWGFLELMQSGDHRREKEAIMKWHRSVIAAIGLVVAVELAFQLAISAELLDADWGPVERRVSGVLFGVGMAIWGNYLPKLLSPWSEEDEWFDWRRVHRFGGWLSSLCGIALVIVWLSFPLEGARAASRGIVLTLCVLLVGRKLMSVVAYSRRQPPAAPLPATSDIAGSD